MSDALRGFARLPPEARSAAGKKGGKQASANGTAHRFTPEEAKAAGRKGGAAKKRGDAALDANKDTFDG